MEKPGPCPRLQTERLLLRALRPEDEGDICALAGDRRVATTTYRIPHPYEPQHFHDWLRRQPEMLVQGTGVNWAIVLRNDQRVIGATGLDIALADERAELGYWIGVPYWNRGYGKEAAAAVVRFAFDHLKLNRIEAHFMSRNPASGRILQHVGMSHEGTLRHYIRKWGVFEDVELYGMLRETYRERMLSASNDDVRHE